MRGDRRPLCRSGDWQATAAGSVICIPKSASRAFHGTHANGDGHLCFKRTSRWTRFWLALPLAAVQNRTIGMPGQAKRTKE
jgi:hypothetical protein